MHRACNQCTKMERSDTSLVQILQPQDHRLTGVIARAKSAQYRPKSDALVMASMQFVVKRLSEIVTISAPV